MWGGVGPQVTKFEQVSIDDHQMTVAGVGVRSDVWRGKGVGPRSDVGGGGTLPIP